MDERWAVAGGDAHKHTITFGAIDATGREIDVAVFAIDLAGMVALHRWLVELELDVVRIGIEGSAGWGRPFTEFLTRAGFDVREVNPARTSDRRRRRRRPKSDREDTLAIAREVLADDQLPPAVSARPVSAAHVELALVCERRRSLVRRRQRVLNEAEAVLAKLPLTLRAEVPAHGSILARLRALVVTTVSDEATHVREAVVWLGEMLADLTDWEARIAELEQRLPALLAQCGSTLTNEVGIGTIGAAELVAEIGDPTRF